MSNNQTVPLLANTTNTADSQGVSDFKPAYIVECNDCHHDYKRCQHPKCPHCGSNSFSDVDDYMSMFDAGAYIA